MKSKITSRLTILMFLFGIILVVSQSYNLRENSLKSAINKAQAIAEVVKSGLTAHMVNGNMDQRGVFLDSIAHAKNIQKIWVIRGDNVTKQYGKPITKELTKDKIDNNVLQTGKMQYETVEEGFSKASLRITIPYNATDRGKLNCLNCHNVKVGDTLGAVSIVLDISDVKDTGIANTIITTIVTLILIALIMIFINKILKPYVETLDLLNDKIDSASNGLFKRININDEDILPNETKKLINNYNNLTDNLMETFHEIDSKLKSFIGKTADSTKSSNPLEASKEIITNLYYIYQFKNQIQLDQDKHEIYNRLGNIFQNRFNIKYINIIEVDEFSKATVVFSGGDLDFCSANIIENPINCRVFRKSEDVYSIEFQKVCKYFNSDKHLHYCIDKSIGKASKLIFNFIFNNEGELSIFKYKLPFIKSYIKEATPEIEAKILFEALENAALRDGLTGLYNRRFLDEHAKKLIPQAKREEFNIGVLMLDIDFFKAVNDEYGHDIGDKILQETAKTIKENTRDSDIVVRYGGEEFIVLLVGIKNEADTIDVANKIREKVAQNEVDVYAGSTMKKTISVGISMFPDDSTSFNTVMKYADLALYEAKEAGRNQVKRYTKEEEVAVELF